MIHNVLGVFTYTLYSNNDCVDRGGSNSITYNTDTCLTDFLYSPSSTSYVYIDDYVFNIECSSSQTLAFDDSDVADNGAILTYR